MNNIILLVAFLGWASIAYASPGQYVRGDYVIFGNTFGHDCGAGVPAPIVGTVGACGTNTADTAMDVYWTISSGAASADTSVTADQKKSTAILELPDSVTVLVATLYYTGFASTADTTATLERDAVFSQSLDATCTTVSIGATAYECEVDVTDIVKANGKGAYTVSDFDTNSITNLNSATQFSAWWMLVIYEDPAGEINYITSDHDFIVVVDGSPKTSTLNGFTFPSTGASNLAKLSIVAYEGDGQSTGDSLSLDGTTYSGGILAADNFFRSARTVDGVAKTVVGDLPQLSGESRSMSGIDMATFDITAALTAGATSLDVTATSGSDTIVYSAAILSVSLGADADLALDYTTSSDNSVVTVNLEFTSNDTATVSYAMAVISFSDLLYVPESSTVGGVPHTDSLPDDDDADYTDSKLSLFLGSIATESSQTASLDVTAPTTNDLTLTVDVNYYVGNTLIPKSSQFQIIIPKTSSSGGDPHFFGILGQKYDVMGESFEIYNIISAPSLQINSRFTPYYKTATQTTPTGTMLGELGFKFNTHTAIFNSNSTVAVIDNQNVELSQDWDMTFNDVKLTLVATNKKLYEIVLTTPDLVITFVRKVYMVSGLEPQFHFDYKLRQLKPNRELHGLLGQTWQDKVFTDKKGAFQYLDGYEDDYRIKSNSLLGDDFKYNKFMNM